MKKNTKNFRKILLFLFIVIIVGGLWTLAPAAIANAPPVAYDVSVTTEEDMPLGITLFASDSDGDPLIYSVVIPPHDGTLSGVGPELTYRPNAQWNGLDFFTYRANDGSADSNLATVNITVNPVNDLPVACNDQYTTNEDNLLEKAVATGVLANDDDVEDELLAVLVTGVSHGTLTLHSDGSFAYLPNADYYGVDSFTYRANDGSADSNLATVTITVCPVNDPPVADANGPYSGIVGLPITFDGTGSYDPDGDALTYSWDFGDGSTATGPSPIHWGYDTLYFHTVTLTVSDGYLESAPSMTGVTVAENHPPVADANGPYSSLPGTPIAFDGTGSYDPDGIIRGYFWNFGDGTYSGAGSQPIHSYDAPGVYNVTLTVYDGLIADCDYTTVDVLPMVLTSIAISPPSITLCVGEQQQFSAIESDTEGPGGTEVDITNESTWSSSNTSVGTFSDSSGTKGLFTALDEGTTTITAVLGNRSATANVTVASASIKEPLITLTKTGSPAVVAPGDNVTYTITYSNTGGDAHNVEITESCPQGVTFIDADPSQSAGPAPIIWNMGTLPAGASGTITIKVKLSTEQESYSLRNVVTLECAELDPVRASAVITVIKEPLITLTKTGSPAVVAPGGNVTYTITYSNTGEDAHDVVITESYPKDVTFISASPAPDSGTNNIWTIGTLSAGASGTITIQVKVPEPRDFNFSESGSVSGEGLVVVSKELSTEQAPYSLQNVVTLECAELDPVRASAVTTVSGVQGTQTSLTEHGSGTYSSEQNINVHTENRSIYFGKSTEAEYKPTSFDFGDFTVNFTTKWNQNLCSKNKLIHAAIRKRIDEATYLEDETISEVDKTSSAMRFDSSFNGSLYIGARTDDSAISEMYLGEFNVSERIAIGKPLEPTPTPTPTWLPCPFPTNESECECEL
jgi:uncharacterized repeat protein (TIGR01451 family)